MVGKSLSETGQSRAVRDINKSAEIGQFGRASEDVKQKLVGRNTENLLQNQSSNVVFKLIYVVSAALQIKRVVEACRNYLFEIDVFFKK